MNPRHSLRKIFGLYQHETNDWLEAVLHRVNRVIDVGANDGYFTFGCAAAFRRHGKHGEIIAIEPQSNYVHLLMRSVKYQPKYSVKVTVVQGLAGAEMRSGMVTLDSLRWETGDEAARTETLVKIDVEGAEMEVFSGAASWINPRNLFLIEVHKQRFLNEIPRLFADRGLTLDRVNQRPFRLIGGEVRDEQNWWLVSQLNSF